MTQTTEAAGQGLRLEVDPATQVAVVTLDRPPVNALNNALRLAIRDTFQSFAERKDVNAVILTAAGSRAFCAGVDLRERAAQRADTSGDRPLDPGRLWRDTKGAVQDCAVPVIAAVNGAAIGAGLGLVTSCDIIIASTEARFGVTEINVGLLGGGAALMRMVGRSKARRMYFTGDLETAAEMERLGAIEAVVEPDQLLPAARALAANIARKSPIALRLAKESLNRLEEFVTPYEAGYRMEQDYTNRLGTFEDAREGTAAFMERREPVWKWR
jgi:enoyl-CoA hydratase